MAVIDTILKLVVAQKAETLVLVPDQVPTVITSDATGELPIPAIPEDLARRLSLELVGSERSAELAGDAEVVGTYRTADGEEFTYQVSAGDAVFRIEMHAVAQRDDGKGEPESAGGSVSQPSRDNVGLLEHAAPRIEFSEPDPEILAALEKAHQRDASDIFLSSGKPAQMRLHGEVRSIGMGSVTAAQIEGLLPDGECHRELATSGSVDFAARWFVSGRDRRFRLNVFRHSHGVAAAIRPIKDRIPTLRDLHLPEDLTELTTFPSGLVLVTGTSGSGKSTTLAALIEHVNQSKAGHIITIEDPIEFEHRQGKSLIHQREVGASVESFSGGLHAALRENPDVILLGEMRDLSTISAALTAAETGHLVLSTLHTGAATAAVSRIVDVFPGHQQAHVRVQLASSLRAVVSQRLLPSTDGDTRVPAIEKLLVTPAVAHSIREGHEHHMRSSMQIGAEEGMITLERSLASLLRSGKIDQETAYRYANDREALQKLME